MNQCGTVIIGRNEGERLKNCIRSIDRSDSVAVYVDSGSDDGSVEFARQAGLHVVELDTSVPFSAARARNAGMELLFEQYPALGYVQFIDGDCEMVADWMDRARDYLQHHTDTAVVCGRRRERYPEHSVYNHMCDMEWNTPVGEAKSCGGDFMARVEALKQVRGFNPSVVAGEEPDLCYRLRAQGWKVQRIEQEMTLHDAKIMRFSQWWKRTLRSGHAYAHNMILHWGGDERFNVRNVISIAVWGALIPLLLITLFLSGHFLWACAVVAAYVVMIVKVARYMTRGKGFTRGESLRYAAFTMIGKIPQAVGVGKCLVNFLFDRNFEIIEYKG